MKMLPIRLNDDEYVARLRKGIDQWDRWRYVAVPGAIIVLSLIGWLLTDATLRMLAAAERGDIPHAQLGLLFGGSMGLALGFFVEVFLLRQIFRLFHRYRTERLLLKYYDAVHDAEDVYRGNIK
ncbi:MAG: hypothetical protein WEB58_18950 [Planctomycetaceae bacterium]